MFGISIFTPISLQASFKVIILSVLSISDESAAARNSEGLCDFKNAV